MTTERLPGSTAPAPAFSIPSIIAIIAAVISFFVGPGFSLILAVVAIIAGLIGVMVSLSPRVRGGMISTLAMIAGAIGIVVAVVRIIVAVAT